jgi:hypothetical protein
VTALWEAPVPVQSSAPPPAPCPMRTLAEAPV